MADIYLTSFVPFTSDGGGSVAFDTEITAEYDSQAGAVALVFNLATGGGASVVYEAYEESKPSRAFKTLLRTNSSGIGNLLVYDALPFTKYVFKIRAIIGNLIYENPNSVTYTTPAHRSFPLPKFFGISVAKCFVRSGVAYLGYDKATGGSNDFAYNVYVNDFKAPPTTDSEEVEISGKHYSAVRNLENGKRYDFLVRSFDKVLRYEDNNINTYSALVEDTHVTMPSSFDDREGQNGFDGFMDALIVTLDTPAGYVLGQIPPKGGVFNDPIWTIHDAVGAFIIDSDGNIILNDPTKLSAGYLNVRVVCLSGDLELERVYVIATLDNKDGLYRFFSTTGRVGSTGVSPADPTQDIGNYMIGEGKTFLFKRGDHFKQAAAYKVWRTGCVIGAYGNPAAPRPILESSATSCMVRAVDDTRYKVCAAVIKDLDIRGQWRSVYIPESVDLIVARCMFGHNVDHPNSSGIHLGWTYGAKVLYCESESCHGDGVYGHTVKPSLGMEVVNHNTGQKIYTGKNSYTEIGYGRFGVPAGSGADNIQFSHEGQEARRSVDIWVHNVECYQNLTGSSLKGAIAVEGTTRVLVENSYLQGKYFGVSTSGNNCTLRNLVIEETGLPPSHSDAQYSYCIGTGGNNTAIGVDIYDCEINTGMNAFSISSYGDNGTANTPSGWFERADYYVSDNVMTDCTRSHRINRPWSGQFSGNLLQNTNMGYVSNEGKIVSTLGEIKTQTIENNLLLSTPFEQTLPNPIITGTAFVGLTLTLEIPPEYSGVYTTIQWRLNGRPLANEVGTTLRITVDHFTAQNPNMPRGLPASEISCLVTVTDKVTGAKFYKKAHSGTTPYIQIIGTKDDI